MTRRPRKRNTTTTINIVPNWAGLVPWILAVLEDPRQPEAAKAPLRAEIIRLAKAMDAINASEETT